MDVLEVFLILIFGVPIISLLAFGHRKIFFVRPAVIAEGLSNQVMIRYKFIHTP